jgi:hypothetical protein
VSDFHREGKLDIPPKPAAVLGVFDLAGLLAATVPPGVSFTVELAGVTISCRA